ncbi:MAG: DUF3108 domain-containing protein [Bacteroidales bacterium]|nr:MAG: DUF3108 domain-containing protein [Bacteroidales bacterium]
MKITARYISIFIIASILLFSDSLTAQQNVNQLASHSFRSGEKVKYRAVYNWGFIWINAGDVVFSVNDTLFNGEDCYYFKSYGWSLKQYDWFFKVRDRFESIVSKDSLKPFWFVRDSYEGGNVVYNLYDFDYKSSQLKVNSFTSNRPSKQEMLPLKPNTFDVLSAIYFCRNINFEGLSKDQKIPLTMAIDNEVFNLYIRYLGRETITLHGGKTYSTFKFSAMLVKGTIFKGGEDLFVWVTDDKYRIPVLVEAKILVGSVKAILVGVEGIRYE